MIVAAVVLIAIIAAVVVLATISILGRRWHCRVEAIDVVATMVVSSDISTRSNSLGLGGFLDRGWQMATGSSTVR